MKDDCNGRRRGKARGRRGGRSLVVAAVAVACLGAWAWADPILALEPDHGPVGTEVRATVAGLPPGAPIKLAWESADASWNVKDGTFLGVSVSKTTTTLASATASEGGGASLRFRAPDDYGYTHNLFVLDEHGERVARQGFVIVPALSVSPASGPPGTPIHVRMTGIGYGFWQMVWHLLYDDKNTGWLSAITSRGTAEVVIPATGIPGPHTVMAMSGTHPVPYLNQQQSPIYLPQVPTVLHAMFTVTSGDAAATAPAEQQGLPRAQGAAPSGAGPSLGLDATSGPVGSPAVLRGTGFPAGKKVGLTWSTVVGNRISGAGWEERASDWATVTAGSDGTFVYRFGTPDDLGGVHHIVATAGQASASVDYTINPSVAEVEPDVVPPGGDITVHLKGVGWSQTANIYTLVMDDAYVGYGCGFNSQGDVTIHLQAPGEAGRHYVQLFPSIYQGTLGGNGAPPDTANANYLLLPMLNAADHPGERLPSFLLSFVVAGDP